PQGLQGAARRRGRAARSFRPAVHHPGRRRLPCRRGRDELLDGGLTLDETDGVRVLIVRHAQQARDGDDGPLTALGEVQAAAAAPRVALTSADRLVASNLLRAVQTATALGRTPERFPDLDEFRFGEQWSWAQADDREDLALWRPADRVAGGESLHQFQARVEG